MQVFRNENINQTQWKDIINISKYSSPFQTYLFYRFINSIKGYSAEAIAIAENDVIQALTVVTIQQDPGIRGFFSRRAIIYGGPVLRKDDKNVLHFLLHENRSLAPLLIEEP